MKHGHSKWRGPRTKEYRTWLHIKSRCYNPNAGNYRHYGGRGIVMCDEWRYDFLSFFNYIGKAPGPKYSIDRIDNNGNYEPGNVRWATQTEQVKNRNIKGTVICNGVKTTDSKAAEILGERIENIQYWSQYYEADVAEISRFIAEHKSKSTKRVFLAKTFPKKIGKHASRALRVKVARNLK